MTYQTNNEAVKDQQVDQNLQIENQPKPDMDGETVFVKVVNIKIDVDEKQQNIESRPQTAMQENTSGPKLEEVDQAARHSAA